jgi:hypothetical protein
MTKLTAAFSFFFFYSFADAAKNETLIANISLRVSTVKPESPNLGAVNIVLEVHFLSNEMWETFSHQAETS